LSESKWKNLFLHCKEIISLGKSVQEKTELISVDWNGDGDSEGE